MGIPDTLRSTFGAHRGEPGPRPESEPFSRFEVFARIERLLDDNLVPRRLSALSTGAGTHRSPP